MKILEIIWAALKLILLWSQAKIEKDAERKKLMEEAAKEITDGLKKRDKTAVISGFNRLNRNS